MNSVQISPLDMAIVAAYLIAMVVIGVCLVRRIKNTDDF